MHNVCTMIPYVAIACADEIWRRVQGSGAVCEINAAIENS